MRTLELCEEISLEAEARSRGVDLFKTLSVYNFSIWFDGARCVLPIDSASVAIVWTNGRCRVYSEHCSSRLVDTVKRILGLYDDVKPFFEIAKRDPLLHQFARTFEGWRVRGCSLWWALVIGVCQQNASFRQGWRMLLSIVKLYNNVVKLEDGELVLLPPEPRHVVERPNLLKEARVGFRARTILEVANFLLSNNIDPLELEKYSSEEIEELLTSIRGVGSYTARLAMVLSLRRYDRPPIDRWLRAIASRVYGVDEKSVDIEWVRRWGRWSGLAALAATIALDAEPLRRALERISRGEISPSRNDIPTPSNLWKFDTL